ncbi:HTH-type transcriptional repressor FabR [Psychrosphaera sp. B3R10]|uniref:HTH-type transcriptional repressor FabR n=1 Tax=unclassified Psychrosphaera TaxID=2641570 RepID=UPI001C0A531C|nr:MULTISPECIES: HTH-type transcriptional repressor FabR [unclassified Psychrosphaera]MBU2883690.1 HTH-type transcriptional repressor FabR [Psychrosphaera sp. I2R16]MBU2988008.1 HTH-type transcriptional repressor FabR [Psychrosphaera sp. B3R10]MDO6720342.1 HTH-type transcriptional repressor FabR [Psychrosphaera sp. 1_MG-2023]
MTKNGTNPPHNRTRAEQKEQTRRAIVDAAFRMLSADHSYANLSLREVAREAGIAPTSFYRHFKDMDELGLTLVDEAGLMLRQLMRQARARIARGGGSVVRTSVETFMEFVDTNSNEFRLLLRERSGTSKAFRSAVQREMMHFIQELSDYIRQKTHSNHKSALWEADALVTIVFNAGADALDLPKAQREELSNKVIQQLRYVTRGAEAGRK